MTAVSSLCLPVSQQALLVYRALEHSDDMIVLIGWSPQADPIVVGGNEAFHKATGFSDERLIERPLRELFPAQGQAEKLIDGITTGKDLRGEFACVNAQGGTFVFGVHLMQVPSADDADENYAVVLGRDITDILLARRRQDSLQGLLAQVFVSIDEAVAIVGGDGLIMLVNPETTRLLGYPANELVGKSTLVVVAPRARDEVIKLRQQQIEQGGKWSYEAPLLRSDGTELCCRVTSAVVEREELKKFRILTIRPATEAVATTWTATSGRIKLVGLEEVRAKLGPRWNAVAARAMATAEAILKRRCGPNDLYERIDDCSFLVSFGEISEREASFRAAVIGREIRQRLIGEGRDAAAARVQALAAEVKMPASFSRNPETRRTALLAGLGGALARVERQARQTLQSVFEAPTAMTEPIRGRNPEEVVASLVRLPDAVEREVTCALSALPASDAEWFDLDGLLLGMAAGEAIASLGRGEQHPVLVNVEFETFSTRKTAERYVALLNRLDQRVRNKLVLLLSGLTAGLAKARLFDAINRLRPLCRGLGVQADDLPSLMTLDLTYCPSPIVAIPAEPIAGTPGNKVRQQLDALHARGIKVLIRRFVSDESAAGYLAIGADMISMAPRTLTNPG